jgi:16S rRNA C1402 N4-methylase RsmH
MYKYVNDISEIAHSIIERFCSNFETAVDCTLGNGYDTDFLKERFNKVYSFDIQSSAVKKYEGRQAQNVTLINDSHDSLAQHVKENADCIMYNLGYLPGGDKTLTTKEESTLPSLQQALNILSPGGIMTIAIYCGHDEGKKEREAILSLANKLPKNQYGVMYHSFLNRNIRAPLLLVIEKNQ